MFLTMRSLWETVSVTGCDILIERKRAEQSSTPMQMAQMVSDEAKTVADAARIASSCDSIGWRISSSRVHVSSTKADDHASCHTSSYACPDGSALRIEPPPKPSETKSGSLTRWPPLVSEANVYAVWPGSRSESTSGMVVMV